MIVVYLTPRLSTKELEQVSLKKRKEGDTKLLLKPLKLFYHKVWLNCFCALEIV